MKGVGRGDCAIGVIRIIGVIKAGLYFKGNGSCATIIQADSAVGTLWFELYRRSRGTGGIVVEAMCFRRNNCTSIVSRIFNEDITIS